MVKDMLRWSQTFLLYTVYKAEYVPDKVIVIFLSNLQHQHNKNLFHYAKSCTIHLVFLDQIGDL